MYVVDGNALYEMERIPASAGPESGHRLASCPGPALLSAPLWLLPNWTLAPLPDGGSLHLVLGQLPFC